MKTRLLAVLLAFAATFLPSAAARAWQPLSGNWPVWCQTVPYALNVNGSADLGGTVTETETKRAFNDWAAVECTGLAVNYNGGTNSVPNQYEGNSVIGWLENGWPHDPNAIGVTGPLWSFNPQTGAYCIREADMAMNGVNYTWTTQSGQGAFVNAYSILLHEGGHYIGLGHSQVQAATMFFAYTGGIDSLQPDDRQGVCTLYPDGQSPQDCTTLGCPAGQKCVGGTCEVEVGDGSLCSPCGADSDCGGPNDYCLAYPDGASYCGKLCQSQADCSGEADFCVNIGGVPQCARFDEAGRPDCASSNQTGCQVDTDCATNERCDATTQTCQPMGAGAGVGEACTTEADCASALCIPTGGGSQCSLTCNWLDPNSCPDGSYCNATATGTCGLGVCTPGSAGTGQSCDTCTVDTDCGSLYCIDGRCSEPCIPNAATECPDGTVCQPASIAGCGACVPAKAIGDPCDTVDDCPSRLCADDADNGRTFCTVECSANGEECPAGFTCIAAGATMICAPPLDWTPQGGGCGVGDNGTNGGNGARSSRDGGCSVGLQMPTTVNAWTAFLFIALSMIAVVRRRKNR